MRHLSNKQDSSPNNKQYPQGITDKLFFLGLSNPHPLAYQLDVYLSPISLS